MYKKVNKSTEKSLKDLLSKPRTCIAFAAALRHCRDGLRVNDLESGSSRCVVLGSAVLTPCEFERRAGRGNTRNWKISIRYSGRPLKDCLESFVGCDGKNRVRFVFPEFPSQGDGSACFFLSATGGLNITGSACSASVNSDSRIVSATPVPVATFSTSPVPVVTSTQAVSFDVPSVTQAASPVVPSVVTQAASPVVPPVVTQAAGSVIPSVVTQAASTISCYSSSKSCYTICCYSSSKSF